MKNIFSLLSLFGLLCSLQANAAMTNSFLSTASLTAGAGTTANQDKTIPETNLYYGELAFEAGYKFESIAPILKASYRNIGQSTDPDTVSGNNLSGSGYLVGAGFAVEFTRFAFSAVYDFFGKYDLSKKTSGGSKVSYSAPSGYHLSLKYLWTGSWMLIADVSLIQYKDRITDGDKASISDNPLSQTLYGIGIGYRF